MANETKTIARYVLETVPGTTPTSALKTLRTTGGGGTVSFSSAESDETHLFEVPDVIRTGASATVRVNTELSYGAIDEMLSCIAGGDWVTNVLKIGDTKKTLTYEEELPANGIFMPYKGCLVDSLSINFATNSKITGSIGMTCANPPTAAAAATAGTGAAVAAPTNPIMGPLDLRIAQEGGSGSLLAGAPGVTAITMEFTRPTTPQPQLGSIALAGADAGRFSARGTFSCYIKDASLIDKLWGDTMTSLSFTVGGAGSLNYNFLFSKVRLTGGGPAEATGGQPKIQTFNWQAVYDVTNSTLKATRTP